MQLVDSWILQHQIGSDQPGKNQSGGDDISISLPFDVVNSLHESDQIPDPYWGRNEYDLRWICAQPWTLSRAVFLDDTAADLVLDGIDGVADIHVNGVAIGLAENAHISYRFDISEIAKIGENLIEIKFRALAQEARKRHAAQDFPIPFMVENTPIHHGNMLRKPQCDFGWDWNIALASIGITGGISIEPHQKSRLDYLHIAQKHHDDGSVTVFITAHIMGDAEGDTVEITFGGGEIDAQVIGRTARGEFTLQNPELWWPAGQGHQPLYDLEVRMGDDIIERRVGLRQMQLITEKDTAGKGFKFCVNGRDIFAKGANWIPADALSGRIKKDAVRDLLQSAVDANMNMIRVWGGGRYEFSWFYDLCDEFGLMVWQDFMFACHLYPADHDFLTNVAEEVRQNVRRLHHHACLALWCGDNELVGALNWYPESIKDRDRYLVLYDRLNRTLEETLFATDPNAIWWPSSPSSGPLDFGDAWHDDSSGDMHFWSVWHENKDFDHYHDIKPRFCSEFGFQSYPSNRVIDTFCDPVDRNIAAPVLESHQKNKGGNERIAATMFRYFRFPVDFENFTYLSQVQQGLAIKTAVSWWRSLKPHCMGALIWQLNDTWPVCSWSSIDYGGDWKLLHHMAKDFYAPVLVTVVPVDGKDCFRVVSDVIQDVELSVEIFAMQPCGTKRMLKEISVLAPPNHAVDIISCDPDLLREDEFYYFEWTVDGAVSRDVHAPKPWKSFDLFPPKIEQRVSQIEGGYEITLRAESLGLFVAIEADIAGRFSDNCFVILPNETVKITFVAKEMDAEPNFIVRDLHSATYGKHNGV